MFSIIVPVYNSEKYLADCLESVLNQTVDDFEIIIVNDGSTDDSQSIIDRFAATDTCITAISQNNAGVSAARNRGLEEARGEFVSFVDSDDRISNHYVESLEIEFERHDPDIIVFGGDSFPANREVDEMLSTNAIVYYGNSVNALMCERGSRPYMCNKAYRLSLLRQNHLCFDSELSLGEDQAFQFLTFPFADVVSFIPSVLYHYRQDNEESASHSISANSDRRAIEHCKMVVSIVESWKNNHFFEQHKSELLNWGVRFIFKWIQMASFDQAYLASKMVVEAFSGSEATCLSSNTMDQFRQLRQIANWNAEHPAVTVIIPIYNSEKHLEECLASLANQSFPNFEVLCVDDGSTDGSVRIVERFMKEDSRFKLFSQKHQFAGKARNLAMKHAHGEYMLFLDSDDYFMPDLIGHSYSRAKAFDADICVFKALSFDEQTHVVREMPWTCNTKYAPTNVVFNKDTNRDNIFCFTTAAPWTKLFRRSFVTKEGIAFQATRSANDLLFVFSSLALADRVVVLDEYLLTYRINEGSSLQSTQDKQPLAFFDALSALKEDLVRRKVYDSVQRSYINFSLDYCIYNLGTLKTRKAFEEVYCFLRDHAFPYLNIVDQKADAFYVYTNRIYERKEDILSISPEEYIAKYGIKLDR